MDIPLALPPTSHTPVWHQIVFSSQTFARCHSLYQLELEMARVTDNADIGVTKITMQCMMVLSMTISWSLVYSEYMQNQRACVFWRKNEVHVNNLHSLQKWKTVFKGKLLIFHETKSVICQDIYSAGSKPLRRRSVPWDSSMKWWKLTGMGKLESKFMEDTVTAATFKEKTRRPSLGYCLLMYCLLILFHILLCTTTCAKDHQNESNES